MRDRSVNYNNLCYINCSNANINTGKCLQFCVWNAQSLPNKTSVLHDYLCHNDIDICAITESWFKTKDTVARAECTPPTPPWLYHQKPLAFRPSRWRHRTHLQIHFIACQSCRWRKKHPFNSPNIQSSRTCGLVPIKSNFWLFTVLLTPPLTVSQSPHSLMSSPIISSRSSCRLSL